MWKLNLYIYFEPSYLFVPVSLSAVTVTTVDISDKKAVFFPFTNGLCTIKCNYLTFLFDTYNKNNNTIETIIIIMTIIFIT